MPDWTKVLKMPYGSKEVENLRTLMLLLIPAFLFSTVACGRVIEPEALNNPPGSPEQTTNATAASPITGPRLPPRSIASIEIKGVTNKVSYVPGEVIELQLKFRNTTSGLLEIKQFPPTIRVSQVNGSLVRTFTAGNLTRSLNPNEEIDYNLIWDQLDERGQNVTFGTYLFEAPVIGGVPEMFVPVIEILVQPPAGIQQGVIITNLSRSTNGTTITLERVELSSYGIQFFALYSPPGYSYANDSNIFRPPLPSAKYSLEEGLTKDAGIPFIIAPTISGIEYVWRVPDVVTPSSTLLVFTITKIGDKAGPWEFRISLQSVTPKPPQPTLP